MAHGGRGSECQLVCTVCNLLNWETRRKCRECKAPHPATPGLNPDRSPPRRRRNRPDRPGHHRSPPRAKSSRPRSAPPPGDSGAGSPAEKPQQSAVPAAKRAQGIREAIEALKRAQAPEAALAPLKEELAKAEREARHSQPVGQRLDSAKAACRKAGAKAEAAAQALQAANLKERAEKAEEEREAKAHELQVLEAELAEPAVGRAECLATAVRDALAIPNGQYQMAALRAAYARYEEHESCKENVPAQAAVNPERAQAKPDEAAPATPSATASAATPGSASADLDMTPAEEEQDQVTARQGKTRCLEEAAAAAPGAASSRAASGQAWEARVPLGGPRRKERGGCSSTS